MTDIVAFLRARLDAREQHVEFVRDFIPEQHQGEFIDPADELREIQSKRRILDYHGEQQSGAAYNQREGDYEYEVEHVLRLEAVEHVLRLLALPFADHSDYDEAWKL